MFQENEFLGKNTMEIKCLGTDFLKTVLPKSVQGHANPRLKMVDLYNKLKLCQEHMKCLIKYYVASINYPALSRCSANGVHQGFRGLDQINLKSPS